MKTPSATKKTKERIGATVGETVIKLNCSKTVIVKTSRLSLDNGVKYQDPEQIKSRTEIPDQFKPMASSSDVPKHSNVQESDFDENKTLINDLRTRPSTNNSAVPSNSDYELKHQIGVEPLPLLQFPSSSQPYPCSLQFPCSVRDFPRLRPSMGSNISKPPTVFEFQQTDNLAAPISSKTQKDTKPIKID